MFYCSCSIILDLRRLLQNKHDQKKKRKTLHNCNIIINCLILYTDYDCSFRGYPLQGKKVKVPANYKGVMFIENKKADTENNNRNLYSTNAFSQFTYWNYDRIPSKNDAVAAALDWIDIAEAVSNFTNNSDTCILSTVLIFKSFLVTLVRNIDVSSKETTC